MDVSVQGMDPPDPSTSLYSSLHRLHRERHLLSLRRSDRTPAGRTALGLCLGQQALEALNEQFAKEYNLDLKKNYRFDPDRKVLVEVEPSDASAAAPPAMQGRPAPPAATTQ